MFILFKIIFEFKNKLIFVQINIIVSEHLLFKEIEQLIPSNFKK